MKVPNTPFRILLLVLAAIIATALSATAANEAKTFASGPADGGRVVVKHSPVLGLNVVVGVAIDGREAGAFAKGHTFERFLTPGRHTIAVFSNGREGTRTTLEVRAGETYSYVAKYRVDKLVLEPVAKPR